LPLPVYLKLLDGYCVHLREPLHIDESSTTWQLSPQIYVFVDPRTAMPNLNSFSNLTWLFSEATE